MVHRHCPCPCHTRWSTGVFCSCFGSCCPEDHVFPRTLVFCETCRHWIPEALTHQHTDCQPPEPIKFVPPCGPIPVGGRWETSIVRRVFEKLIGGHMAKASSSRFAHDLVKAQPMDADVGRIFYTDHTYGQEPKKGT